MEIPTITLDFTTSDNKLITLSIDPDEDIEKKINLFCITNDINPNIKSMIIDQIVEKINEYNDKNEAEYNENELEENYENQNSQEIEDSQKNSYSKNSEFRGVQLYQRYFDKLKTKKEHLKNILESRLKEEMKEATFQPKISETSKRLSEIKQGELKSIKVEDRLLLQGQEQSQRISKIQTNKILETNNFPFQPKINDKSNILASISSKKRDSQLETISRDNSNIGKTSSKVIKKSTTQKDFNHSENRSNFEMSFDESKVKSKNQTNLSSNNTDKYTFTNMVSKDKRPFERKSSRTPEKNLANIDISIVTDRSNSNEKIHQNRVSKLKESYISNQSKIHETLYSETLIIKAKHDELVRKWDSQIIPFKPKLSEKAKRLKGNETVNQFITRLMNSKKVQNDELQVTTTTIKKEEEIRKTRFVDKIPVLSLNERNKTATNLDSYYDNKLLENQMKIKNEDINNNLEKKKHWLENSMKIVLKMKIEKYKEIFDSLDRDNDGLISAKSIKLYELEENLLETLTPIFDHLQKNGNEMNFKEFCLLADKLLSNKIFKKD